MSSSWQPPPPQGGGGGAGAGGGGGSGWGPPSPSSSQQQQQQWNQGGQAGQQQQYQQPSTFVPTASSSQQQQAYGVPPPPPSAQQQVGGGGWGAPQPQQQQVGGGGWGAPQPQQQQQQYGGYSQQTASIAQAAIGAALGAGGLNSMDAANLMAGFATAALNNSGGGDRGGGQGGFFEKGASWATSRLSALVGGSAPHQQQHTGEGNPDGAFDGGAAHQQNYSPRGGGLFSFLSPVGGAAALSVSPSYCRAKLLLLSAPWLRRWPYARVREHQSVASTGGPTRYAPPSRDVHAPDLYIPAMALATLALLRGAAAVFSTRSSSPLSAFSRRDQSGHSFSPETISNAVSSLATAWLLSGAALKAALLALGSGAAAAVPLAELAAYAGYPLFHGAAVCAVRGAGSLASSSSSSSAFSAPHASPSSLSSSAATANNILNKLGSGSASGATGAARWAGDAAVLWGGAAAGVFLVRSLKRVLFQDARGRDEGRRAAAPAYGGGNGFGGGDPNFGYGGGIPSQSQSSSPSSAATTSRSNYVLLLLWFAQFPLVAWLARGCRVAS